jgi:hypothetical protein
MNQDSRSIAIALALLMLQTMHTKAKGKVCEGLGISSPFLFI